MSQGASTTSRVWSCQTLADGVDNIAALAKKYEEEEYELEQRIKEP